MMIQSIAYLIFMQIDYYIFSNYIKNPNKLHDHVTQSKIVFIQRNQYSIDLLSLS